jgi:hypothetical protein
MKNVLFSEMIAGKQVAAPADLNGAAVTGARVSAGEGYKIAVELSFGDSTAAACTVSFEQHDAAAGGNSKALNVQTNYYHKIDGQTAYTKVEIRPDDSGLSDSVDLAAQFANDGGIVVFEFLPEHLDAENGFSHLSVNVADSTAAKVMSGIYQVRDVKNGLAWEVDL